MKFQATYLIALPTGGMRGGEFPVCVEDRLDAPCAALEYLQPLIAKLPEGSKLAELHVVPDVTPVDEEQLSLGALRCHVWPVLALWGVGEWGMAVYSVATTLILLVLFWRSRKILRPAEEVVTFSTPFCEWCGSYHPVPTSAEHHEELMCVAPRFDGVRMDLVIQFLPSGKYTTEELYEACGGNVYSQRARRLMVQRLESLGFRLSSTVHGRGWLIDNKRRKV